MNVTATRPRFRASALLVACSVMFSLMTWGIYAAAYLDKAGDEAEAPLILLAFGNPILAIAGVIFTIKTIDVQARRAWRIQFLASLAALILAVLALIVLYEL